MRYLLLINNEASAGAMPETPPTEEEMGRMMAEYNAFTQLCRDRGAYLGGEALEPVTAATTVRVRDGQTLTTDGPFIETKEALGGFYLVECANLDAALELAAACPGAKSGSVEVRPVWEIPEGADMATADQAATR